MSAAWHAIDTALDRAAGEGRTIRFWLRDDDATAVTPALERLRHVCDAAAMPVLLAVIPAHAQPDLAAWLDDHPSFTPCQHGYAHANHAAPGERACELGGRPLETVEAELRQGRERLEKLFGARLSKGLVPPWNRIDPALIPRLPALGFDRLSTFGPPGPQEGIPKLNADLDIIDWRHGRVGRDRADIAGKLAALISASRDTGHPIGLLTHHLVHDATAWTVLEEMLERLRTHPAVVLVAGATLA